MYPVILGLFHRTRKSRLTTAFLVYFVCRIFWHISKITINTLIIN
nr:MAG TPA: hypothetical protein [Caudoviricetes sp.]